MVAYGNLKVKIDEYEDSKAARAKAATEAKFNSDVWQQRGEMGGGRDVQDCRCLEAFGGF
jgi:hypothetical protein